MAVCGNRFLCFMLLAFAAVACGGNSEPGRFSLTFTWEEKPEQSVWGWVRVERRLDPAIPEGNIVALAGPQEYNPAAGEFLLNLDSVDHGDNLVVVVEIREADNEGLPISYFGISDSFSLHAGDDKTIKVPLMLKEPEVSRYEGTIELLHDGEAMTTVNAQSVTHTSLHTRTVGATSMVLSNDPSWTANYTALLVPGDQVTCTTEEVDGVVWQDCLLEDWDLTAGLPLVEDGLVTIYVKFMDLYGNASAVHKASVILDSAPPAVLLASVSPELAPAGATVFLSVTTQEALGTSPGDVELLVSPQDAGTPHFSEPQQAGDSNTWFWTSVIPLQDGVEGAEYTFLLNLTDPLGNRIEAAPAIDEDGTFVILTIDAVPPVILDSKLSVIPEVMNQSGESIPAVGPEDQIVVTLNVVGAQGLA